MTKKVAGKSKQRSMASGRKPAKRKQPATRYGLLWLPVAIFFLMLSGLSVFYIWERIRLRELSREIIELENARRLIQEENGRLHAQAEQLGSYSRIYRIATTKFGFVELKPVLVTLPEDEE